MKYYKICFGDHAPGEPGTGVDECFYREIIFEAQSYEEAEKEAKRLSYGKLGDFTNWIEEIEKPPNTLRVCVLGHSGIGKSPLSKLFKVKPWEPLRVRPPRNEADRPNCMSPEKSLELENKYKNEKPLNKNWKRSPNKLRVFKDWSSFEVRGKKQWLEHTKEAKDGTVSLRVEVYAPVLVELLNNLSDLKEAFTLDLDNFLIFILNPTSCSFKNMKEPSEELKIATRFAITMRSYLQDKDVDPEDVRSRVKNLNSELQAWKQLINNPQVKTLECKKWPHFEFVCLISEDNARATLRKARSSLLKPVPCDSHSFFELRDDLMLADDEISELEKTV